MIEVGRDTLTRMMMIRNYKKVQLTKSPISSSFSVNNATPLPRFPPVSLYMWSIDVLKIKMSTMTMGAMRSLRSDALTPAK